MVAVYVNAGNDSNGNPRRGWVIFGDGSAKFVDEGYDGKEALDREYGGGIEDTYPAMPVTPKYYREMKKKAKK